MHTLRCLAVAAIASLPTGALPVGAEELSGLDEFGVIGVWRSREDKPGPGTTTLRTESTLQFTLAGEYLIERKVTLDGKILSQFKDKGRFHYTPTGKLDGRLEVALNEGAGPLPPRGQIGKVHWNSIDEWVYIVGEYRLVHTRVNK